MDKNRSFARKDKFRTSEWWHDFAVCATDGIINVEIYMNLLTTDKCKGSFEGN